MAAGARIDSPDTIRAVKVYWVKFDDNIRQAVSGIRGDVQRTGQWLHDQMRYWKVELRKSQDAVQLAQSQLTMAKHGSDATRKNSFVDEQKALRRAQARKEECERKLEVTRRWCTALPTQTAKMMGPVDSLSNSLENTTPAALSQLENLIIKLEEYFRTNPPPSSVSRRGF